LSAAPAGVECPPLQSTGAKNQHCTLKQPFFKEMETQLLTWIKKRPKVRVLAVHSWTFLLRLKKKVWRRYDSYDCHYPFS
jgi:hypothetical protein